MRFLSRGSIFAAAIAWGLLAGAVRPAVAQSEADEDAPVAAPSLPSPARDNGAPVDERVLENEARIEQLEAQLANLREQVNSVSVRFTGYADIGFFAPFGNDGVGWKRDFGFKMFPEFADKFAWVFVGDILATTINTRGEAASLGDGPAVDRFDSVDSSGAPGFIANELNFRTDVSLGSYAVLHTSINFVPRSGGQFALGDFFDLDIAELEWVVTEGTSIFAGKTLPVFGIEYKERKSDQRFGVTPSLIHRYTSGTQLGLKIRSKLLWNWLIVAASLTNGSPTTEQFHFYNEIDTNSGKTLNGRLAVNVPVGDFFEALLGDALEIGLSGVWGPQDRATNNEGHTWFVGVDLTYRGTSFALKGQWMIGQSDGRDTERVWGLELRDSGYLEINWLPLPWLGVLVRGGVRNADVTLTNERIYITRSWRATGGLKVVFNQHIELKAEYLHNGEFGDVDEFANDIFTSSLVLSY